MELTAETREFIRQHRRDDVRTLALQGAKYKDVDMPAALRQIEGWQTACRKLPLWSRTEDILYPPHLSMEQCSSEETARYKASVLGGGDTFADLTGGFGVDCSYLSCNFKHAFYVERDPVLCDLARHNFAALGLPHVEVRNEASEQFVAQMPATDAVFIDPARRDAHGGKTVAITDCTPDVKALFPLLKEKAGRILIKLSPMLDIAQALRDLPGITDVHVLSVHNECKELLLLYDSRTETAGTMFYTINMGTTTQQFEFSREEEENAPCDYATTPEAYLYEPNTALLKAGAFHVLSAAFGVKKLQQNSHLYTSGTLRTDFPGRVFKVDGFSGFGKKELKALLNGLKQANLTVRNFPASVADLRKRLKLKEGGDTFLFATTLQNGGKVLVKCHKENV